MTKSDSIIFTVGELIEALSAFPKDQEIRLSVPATINTEDPVGHYIGKNLHEWGLVAGELWSDGVAHAVVQIPVIAYHETVGPIPEPSDKWLREDPENDPDGEETYFGD